MTLDLAQFHEAFFQESFEALDSMEAALLRLSAGAAADPETINNVFRVAHSIKGGAATFGFARITAVAHVAETLLDQLRAGQRPVTPRIVDLQLAVVDVMREMLAGQQQGTGAEPERVPTLLAELEELIRNVAAAGDSPAAPAPSAAVQPASTVTPAASASSGGDWKIVVRPGPKMLVHGNDPLRIFSELAELGALRVCADAARIPPTSDLDPEVCLLAWELHLDGAVAREQIEQVFEWAEGDCEITLTQAPAVSSIAAADDTLLADALAAGVATQAAPAAAGGEAPGTSGVSPAATSAPAHAPEHAAAPTPEAARPAAAGESSIRVSIEKIDELMNTVGELVITQSMLSQCAAQLDGHTADELKGGLAQLDRQMRALQESVMRVRMLPISFVFNRFPRMVRDLGQKLGKQVELKLIGEQTELDKTVLEKIGDPMVHLVRNSMDHGLESTERRIAAGKSEVGTITLNAYHKGGNVTVEVSDDGGGLNRDKILAKARERGLVGPDEELSDDRIYNLIFAPGFSTADVISDVSGRGVGMDVVRRNINELGGHIQVVSEPGHGTTVRIRLPLTLAILDGQLVRVGTETYVVPLVAIVETIQIQRERVNSVAGRAELFRLRDDYIPIIRLYELFGIEPDTTDLLDGLLMIVEADGRRVGIFVDDLLAQQQVVIKSLETNFRPIQGLAGATMLGDGRVALIIDVPGLIMSAEAGLPRAAATTQVAA
jgi:two-component system chemotaxis sensor kinase CheA